MKKTTKAKKKTAKKSPSRRRPPGLPRPRAVKLKHPLPDNAGPFSGHDVDPEDSRRLLELRELIDELGWSSEEDEERGDYAGRLRQIIEQRTRLAALLVKLEANPNGPEASSITETLEEVVAQMAGEARNSLAFKIAMKSGG